MTPDAAAADAAAGRTRQHALPGLRGAFAVWLVLLGVLLLTAACSTVDGPLHALARRVYPDTPHPTPVTAASLLIHNLAIALAPLALCLVRWHTSRLWRAAGDLLVTALLARQTIMIGLGIGAWPQIAPHLPHLPLELAGLVAGAACWYSASRQLGRRATTAWVLGATALLLIAAIVESRYAA